jgi:5,10-methylenetetrahydromethanopterin reductase
MKFGIQTYRSMEETIQLGKLAERVGFDYIWVADVPALRDAVTTLAVLAMNTKKIKLGTAVAGFFTRHPLIWASTATTIQELSKGRFTFGISVGGFLSRAKMGIDLKKPARTTRDQIAVFRKLLKGEPATYEDEYITMDDFKLAFPVDPHPIPIYVGARGPKMLELTGEVAEGLLTEGSARTLRESRKYLKKGAEKAGRNMSDFETAYLPTSFWLSKEVSKKDMDMLKMSGAPSILDSVPEIHRMLGLDKIPVEMLRKALIRGDFSKVPEYLPDEILREFAIIGDLETCISRIEELEKCGMTQLVLVDTIGPSTSEVLKTFGEKVIPSFK